MRKFIVISFLVLVTLIFAASALQVHAQDDPWVRTEDLDDSSEDYFEYIGETVRIVAHSYTTPYTIEVYDPTNTLVKTISVSTVDYSDDHTDISSSQGLWKLKLLHVTTEYATGSFFVIPETLGVATALIACFAGLGVKQFRRKS